MELEGEIAVVVGAGSAIGQAVCRRLIGEGMAVTGVDTTFPANAVGEQRIVISAFAEHALGPVLQGIAADADSIRIAHFACASSAPCMSILNAGPADFDSVMERDLGALFMTMRAFLPGMVDRQLGSFLASCSIAGLGGLSDAVLQAGGDHSVIGLVRGAAMDVAAHGVTVNAICHPLDFSGTAFPDAVADAAVFLSSPMAQSITGHHFVVDAAASAGAAEPAMRSAAR